MGRKPWTAQDWALLILVCGATSLPIMICLGSFGRAFYLAIQTKQDFTISDAATQLLTSLGSALVGSAASFIAGIQVGKHQKREEENEK
jgi:hypothetical protein